MAETVRISGDSEGKLRNGWAVLGLGIITFGIYTIFWQYTIHRELRDVGRARGDQELGSLNPTMSTLSLVLGWILLYIPPLVTLWRLGGRIRRAQELSGSPERIGQGNTFMLVIPGALLIIPAIYWYFHVTKNINAALQAVGQAPAAIDAPPAPVVTQSPAPEAPAPQPAGEGMTGGDPLKG